MAARRALTVHSAGDGGRTRADRTPTVPARPSPGPAGAVPTLAGVRLTHFRQLMADEFGAVRASSISSDHVFAALDGRTVEQALEAGTDPRDVWRAVCAEFEVPVERR
jgi:hypothetical protein